MPYYNVTLLTPFAFLYTKRRRLKNLYWFIITFQIFRLRSRNNKFSAQIVLMYLLYVYLGYIFLIKLKDY